MDRETRDRLRAEAERRRKIGEPSDEQPKRQPERAVVHHHHHHGATKNPGLAAVLAFFWPGVGHIYAGRIAFGLLFFVGWPVIVAVAFLAGLLSQEPATVLASALVVGCAYVFQVYHAHSAASQPDHPARHRARRRR